MKLQSRKGFSLIEILLTVSVIAMLAGIALPYSLRMVSKNDLDTAVFSAARALAQAQSNAQAGYRDSAWGVKAQRGSITLFQGASYAARNVSHDETSSIGGTATSGNAEIVFQKLYGEPTAAGSLTLTGLNNDTRSITISTTGVLSY